jgi:hypothetical protein
MQWNLNANTSSVHLNVLPAWERGVNGDGVLVAIVDDGMQADHPDLVAQFNTEVSWSVVDNSANVAYEEEKKGGRRRREEEKNKRRKRNKRMRAQEMKKMNRRMRAEGKYTKSFSSDHLMFSSFFW